jgi:hypothetical protein
MPSMNDQLNIAQIRQSSPDSSLVFQQDLNSECERMSSLKFKRLKIPNSLQGDGEGERTGLAAK